MPFSRTCERCGAAFEAQGNRAKFCSKSCKNAAGYARRTGRDVAEVRPQPRRTQDECPVCGRSLDGMRPHAVYCSRACKDRQADRRRRAADPDRDRRRYVAEGERRRAYQAAYHQRRPDVSKAARAKRKAAIRGDRAGFFTSRDWLRLVRRFNHRCAYCLRRRKLQVEHVVPLSRGGLHRIGNILPACSECNFEKHTSTVMEWRMRKLRRGVIPNLSPSLG